MKKILTTTCLLIAAKITLCQNVGINNSGATPDVSAMLDIVAIDKGLLVPRVALTGTTDAVTIATPQTSLLVYNTATAGVSPNNVVPGYYYNSGTTAAPSWVRLATGNGPSWLLTGNAGTTPSTSLYGVAANNNFIGTTDAKDWVMVTAGLERARLLAGGQLSIGTKVATNNALLNVVSSVASTSPYSNSTLYLQGPGQNGFGLSGIVDIFDNQATPQREVALGYSVGAPWYGMINMYGSSGGTEQRMGEFDFMNRVLQPADARVATITTNTPAGVSNSGSIEFITRNAGTFISNAFWINYNGKTAVGNRAPVSMLDVEGNVSIGTTYAGGTAAPTNGMIVEGNTGIGIAAPIGRLDVQGPVTRTGTTGTAPAFYVSGTLNTGQTGPASGNIEFRHDNGTQGIGFGYNTIYQTGSNANQDLNLLSRGSSPLTLNAYPYSTGNVGVAVTNPAYNLEINGTFGFGNGTSGSYRSRTETRNDAGLMATQSGFYETSAPAPAADWPTGASSWWHLIDCRHSNNGNNYAMQFSGSFFDQNLYFRKTNNSASQPWQQVLTSSSITCGTTNYVPKMTSATTFGCSQVFDNGTNVGINTAAPSYKLDVNGLGGGNVDVRTNGRLWSNSTAGGMWLSDLTNCFVGTISSTQFGFWSSGVGWNAFNINTGNGYTGIGTSTPTCRLNVKDDGDNIPVIYGQNTNVSAGTTSFGVRGECGSTGLGSAGVSGVSTNSSSNEIGVVGDYSLWGAAVFGLAWAANYTDMPSSRDFGVFGTVNYSTGTGVYGNNTNTTLGSAYGMYCSGNFATTGAKSASIPTSQGNQLVYSMESPEVWFEDLGNAKLAGGSIHILLNDLFLEAIYADDAHPFHVFTQEMGESNGLIVIPDADWKGFVVKEKAGGTSNIPFSFRIMAKRRFYEDVKFGVDANQAFENNLQKGKHVEPATTDPNEMKRFVEEKTREKEAQKKIQPAAQKEKVEDIRVN